MNRRSFLKAILGAAAYEPARKLYVFAPRGGWNVSPGEALFFLDPGQFRILHPNRGFSFGVIPEKVTLDAIYMRLSTNLYLHGTPVLKGFNGSA